MTTTDTRTAIPGYTAGTWTIDPVHSEVGFSVRHMMVSKVRGRFTSFSGEIVSVAASSPVEISVRLDFACMRITPGLSAERPDARMAAAAGQLDDEIFCS